MDFEVVHGDGDQVIKGTPVGRGKYKGVARVVTRLSDAHEIQHVNELI